MVQGLRLFLLSGLMCAARGLRVIDSLEFNCSQPGIRCRVVNSNCLDLSWIQPYKWTPTAPSDVEVTAGIGVNDLGNRVPVLQINWTVSIDSSILNLQGAEISVLELGTSLTRCVQFQFKDTFPSQRDRNGQAWKFFYNNFEVNPGHKYHISVQHLPKEDAVNRKEREFTAPGCSEAGMMRTDTCCNLGHCWNPNITVEFTGDKLIVTFTPRMDAHKYGVRVRISPMRKTLWSDYIYIQPGATTERRQVTILNPVPYSSCWYNVSIWPYMPDCETDCVRQWYVPECPCTLMPPPVPPGRAYVWPIAAAVSIVVMAVTLIFLCFQACITRSVPKPTPQQPEPVAPPLVKQKVWLVYSADHKLYVDVVIRLADFLRVEWGLDVVLDRHQIQEIGISSVMAWSSYQKDQIDRVNGTILILCSRGTQAKWRAMQNRREARVTLPEDTSFMFGDPFTSALTLILPDFQKAKPSDGYVVAYFSDICDVGDIPSPLELCPRYALIENLKMLFFRIQRIESHQPNVQYNIDVEGTPSYRHLMKAIEQCRAWQEKHSDWFGKQYLLAEAEEEDESVEEEDVGSELTRRNYPQIHHPEAPIPKLSPCIIEPDPIRSLNPSLVFGPSSVCVVPKLNEEHSPVSVLQPSLNTESLGASYRQEPYLVDVDKSLPIYNDRVHLMDLSTTSDQGFQSEDLGEAQKWFLFQSFLEDQPMNPNMVFQDLSPSSEDPRAPSVVDLEDLLTVNDPVPQVDLSISDLKEAQLKFFSQSILENQPGDPMMVLNGDSILSSEGCLVEEDESGYDCRIDLSIPRDQDVQIFFDHQHLAPDVYFNAVLPLQEHLPLFIDVETPLQTPNEPLLQTDPSRHNGQGSPDQGEPQKIWYKPSVLEVQRVTPKMDVHADELDIYEEPDDLYGDVGSSRGVMGRTNNAHCHSADLGYGTLNHNRE